MQRELSPQSALCMAPMFNANCLSAATNLACHGILLAGNAGSKAISHPFHEQRGAEEGSSVGMPEAAEQGAIPQVLSPTGKLVCYIMCCTVRVQDVGIFCTGKATEDLILILSPHWSRGRRGWHKGGSCEHRSKQSLFGKTLHTARKSGALDLSEPRGHTAAQIDSHSIVHKHQSNARLANPFCVTLSYVLLLALPRSRIIGSSRLLCFQFQALLALLQRGLWLQPRQRCQDA